ncbi:hypothetical protein HELRODRAFT_163255 [Helobdella robusta]|uniref:Uncharacterized protein n=1 Tax=Helobdella robusta TaxID=6412 RepID=T1ETU6_HELRO|nr:hypothetical protein HELRODRAFT_163255 [Helobdella robusta]ESN96214.1 hypothetical protein HELRODRAFT_163255 [Helobdella robusta]
MGVLMLLVIVLFYKRNKRRYVRSQTADPLIPSLCSQHSHHHHHHQLQLQQHLLPHQLSLLQSSYNATSELIDEASLNNDNNNSIYTISTFQQSSPQQYLMLGSHHHNHPLPCYEPVTASNYNDNVATTIRSTRAVRHQLPSNQLDQTNACSQQQQQQQQQPHHQPLQQQQQQHKQQPTNTLFLKNMQLAPKVDRRKVKETADTNDLSENQNKTNTLKKSLKSFQNIPTTGITPPLTGTTTTTSLFKPALISSMTTSITNNELNENLLNKKNTTSSQPEFCNCFGINNSICQDCNRIAQVNTSSKNATTISRKSSIKTNESKSGSANGRETNYLSNIDLLESSKVAYHPSALSPCCHSHSCHRS